MARRLWDLTEREVFGRLLDAVRLICRYEGARVHERRWREHGTGVGREMAHLVATGLALPEEQYAEALDWVAAMRAGMAALFREYPAILTPAAPGPAPRGLESTGDPRMNAPWSGLGGPAACVPMPAAGLPPMGMQITAARGEDGQLIGTAIQIEAAFRGA